MEITLLSVNSEISGESFSCAKLRRKERISNGLKISNLSNEKKPFATKFLEKCVPAFKWLFVYVSYNVPVGKTVFFIFIFGFAPPPYKKPFATNPYFFFHFRKRRKELFSQICQRRKTDYENDDKTEERKSVFHSTPPTPTT